MEYADMDGMERKWGKNPVCQAGAQWARAQNCLGSCREFWRKRAKRPRRWFSLMAFELRYHIARKPECRVGMVNRSRSHGVTESSELLETRKAVMLI